MNVVVFDVDGVVADTQAIVKEAYASVGVSLPDDAWGRPWREWLPDAVGKRDPEIVHTAKTAAYEAMLRRPHALRPLAGATVARILYGQGHFVGYLTGASERAARAVLDEVGAPGRIIRAECSTADKIKELHGYGGAVYVDDTWDSAFRTASHFRFVHFHAMNDPQQLMKENQDIWTQ